jgi:hypothetical protein
MSLPLAGYTFYLMVAAGVITGCNKGLRISQQRLNGAATLENTA